MDASVKTVFYSFVLPNSMEIVMCFFLCNCNLYIQSINLIFIVFYIEIYL